MLVLSGFFIFMFIILTIPTNLLVDFGIMFSTVVRGSAGSNNLIKELVFDLLSITIVFLRFLVQNVRFVFILLGLLELLEWTLSVNHTVFNYTNINNTNDIFFYINNFDFLLVLFSLPFTTH